MAIIARSSLRSLGTVYCTRSRFTKMPIRPANRVPRGSGLGSDPRWPPRVGAGAHRYPGMTQLADYRGRYAGRDVFVFGSGPSLRRFPLAAAADGVKIAVNASVMHLGEPSYFFTSDGGVAACDYWPHVLGWRCPIIASSEGAGEHLVRRGLPPGREVCFYSKAHTTRLDPDRKSVV